MGKVPTAPATAGMKSKKKGRPSRNPFPEPVSSPQKPSSADSSVRRSARRNPNHFNSPSHPEFDDDEDERKEKKVKLVVRLPQSDEKGRVAGRHRRQRDGRHSRDSESDSGSGSDQESEDRDRCLKKRRINGGDGRSDDGVLVQDYEAPTVTDTPLNGSPMESGPTTPLPEKKLLVFILDRLQKKDTYGVFSEPVGPNELPDYFDIIERPMDFGTVRKKLDNKAYKCLEELEADVFLICSNAMKYNASDTVYYRQARTIQDLAKRDFENLKHEGDNGEPQPKIVRRGRPPINKNQKKSLEASPVESVERIGVDISSGATLANEEDKATGSTSYNLRKGTASFRCRITDSFVSSHRLRNTENHSESSADWNNEFPASILRADMKHGKKNFTVDENKRDSYKLSLSLASSSPMSISMGHMKRLVAVGLQEPLAYARSLARYGANLGPVAWKIASKKIEAVLPRGTEYGPGWVGDKGVSSHLPTVEKQISPSSTAGDCSSSKLLTPATSDLASAAVHRPSQGSAEAVNNLNSSQNELPGQPSWRAQFPAQQNHMHNALRNGFTGMYGYNPSMVGVTKVATISSFPSQMAETIPKNESPSSPAMNTLVPEQGKDLESHGEPEIWNLGKSRQASLAAAQQAHNLPADPPDLNVRVPAGSPSSSSLQIGSPRQPDLALQL